MIPTAVTNPANNQTISSAIIGITSLILEGRALSDDNFIVEDNDSGGESSSSSSSSSSRSGGGNCKNDGRRYSTDNLISKTSTATTNNLSFPSLIWSTNNLTNNPTINTLSSSSSGYYSTTSSQRAVTGNTSGTSSSLLNNETTDATIQHFQRLRQKLGQLRQSSPSTSWECLPPEQGISVSSNSSRLSRSGIGSGDIPTEGDIEDNDDGELDPFIHQRNRSSSKSHGGSSGGVGGGQAVASDSNLLNTLQSLASTCLRHSTPRSFSKNRDWLVSTLVFSTPVNANCGNSTGSSSNISSNINNSTNNSGGNGNGSNNSNIQQSIIKAVQQQKSNNINRQEKISPPKQGPHCDQFLKKMGILKADASDIEEHICDMANLNEICYRWQIHCRQIDVIISKSDPICIEVYLGPENHEILLEQWIIQQVESNTRSSTPNMTLQSLCNAIRSQLYFSQITAWTDLIRKSKPYDREIMNNIRIKIPCKSNGVLLKPRLDIFYRIKAYDSTACFISKPNVHNFPNIVISENYIISVCLKSLPRLQGGIPKHDDIFTPSSLLCNPPSAAVSSTIEHHHHLHHNDGLLDSHHGHNYHHHHQIPSSSIVNHLHNQSTPGETIMLDDRLNLPCQEKGKHKCAFDEEEGSSDAVTESACSEGLSHREKQLIKYKKRIMKRDKKNKKPTEILSVSATSSSSSSSSSTISGSSFSSSLLATTTTTATSSSNNKTNFENFYGIIDGGSKTKLYQNNVQDNLHHHHSSSHHDQQKLNEIRSINSIRPPLYQARSSIAEGIQTNSIEMVSVGTQTSDAPMYCSPQQQQTQTQPQLPPVCKTCGKDMKYICWNCEDNSSKLIVHSCDGGGSNSSCNDLQNNSTPSVETPRKIGKGELLLQAIQRTPQRNKTQQQDLRNNNNNAFDFRTPTTTNSGDCQLCKRQKIRHNYNDQQHKHQQQQQQHGTNVTPSSTAIYRAPNNSHHSHNQQNQSKLISNGHQHNNLLPAVHVQMNKCQRLLPSSTANEKSSSLLNNSPNKCDCTQPSISGCSNDEISNNSIPNKDNVSLILSNGHITNGVVSPSTPPPKTSTIPAVCRISCSSSSTSLSSSSSTKKLCDDDLKNVKQEMGTPEIHPSTIPKNQLKPRLLDIKNYNSTRKSMRNNPKVNLLDIFYTSSSPIPISSGESFSFDSSDDIVSPEIPVQKSNSAPTLPNSPSLSPRFLKQAAIYKRRSRHLSDRSSERSSFCSDEQYSDEDLDSVYSPATSPIKTKVFMRSNLFGRKSLLGSLEESLLQKRFIPKTQVSGFKVLLGASGGFCPTQLTIPAATYCYEFSGQTLSTPYVCEIRLSRKGYTIPRVGTVQATLLNPLGTVVRMFVIPYDFRDMPPMHQTFIRQRILAIDDNDGKPLLSSTSSSTILINGEGGRSGTEGGGDGTAIINATKKTPSSLLSSSSFSTSTSTKMQQSSGITKNDTAITTTTTTTTTAASSANETLLNSNINNKSNILLASGSQPELREISFGDQMRSLRYSIHLRFQTTRSGRLALHTDIKFLISRRTDCDTAAAHAKGALESPNELRTITISPDNPKYSARHDSPNKI